jgi:hypothetical protein
MAKTARSPRGVGVGGDVDLTTLRRLLAAGKHAEAYEAVFQAYREHRSAKRVAPVFGCALKEWVQLLAEYPPLREERERALQEVGREEVRALRRRLGLSEGPAVTSEPKPSGRLELNRASMLEPRAAPPRPLPRLRRAAAGPPLAMELKVDVAQEMPAELERDGAELNSESKRSRFP